MATNLLRSVSLAWCTVGLAVAQQTWIVDSARGAGWQFESIQPAVDAAAPGDTILIRGQNTAYAGATIRKGVTLSASGIVGFTSAIRVTAVPIGERAAIVGLTAQGVAGQFGDPISVGYIDCTDCGGTVHLENVTVFGSYAGPGLSVTRCAQVTAVRSAFRAGYTSYLDPRVGFLVLVGSNVGLRAVNSSVALVESSASGVFYRLVFGFSEQIAAHPAIVLSSSRLLAAQCTLVGADALCGGGAPLCFPFGTPQSAITAQNAILTIRASSLQAGGRSGCTLCPPTNVPAIQADATTAQQPADADLRATVAGPGQSMQVILNSSVSAPFATYVSLPAQVIPAPVGFWIDPVLAVPLALGVTQVGTRTDILPIPSSVPLGLTIGLQTILLSQGQLTISTPTFAALL